MDTPNELNKRIAERLVGAPLTVVTDADGTWIYRTGIDDLDDMPYDELLNFAGSIDASVAALGDDCELLLYTEKGARHAEITEYIDGLRDVIRSHWDMTGDTYAHAAARALHAFLEAQAESEASS